jgi:NADP-dependent 3-hydroxy acid dehydrogenase YdfG
VTEKLAGQSALVTGAGGAIGAAIAERLAAEGATVSLVGRRRAALERLAARIGPSRATVHVADLTSDIEVKETARSVVGRSGRLDVLVHSNGTYASGVLERVSLGTLDQLWAANVRSPVLLTQRLLPALRAASGQIAFVNSSAGLDARAQVGAFAATQHALHAIADALRAEVNPDGIRVVSVYPGRTASKRQERIFRSERRPYEPERLLQPSDVADVLVHTLTLPRTAEVTDVRVRSMTKP